MKREDAYYAAMLARDHRFDGKFFVGVKTTGIYCRPICPAKPKRENVEFFANALAAERAGYRPCLRCRPESAPSSPAWIGKSAVVRRAIKQLHDLDSLDFREDEFAGKFGVTARHLRRLFMDEIGKTPKQLLFENRLNLARQLISETAMPVTTVAFTAGFRSIRRFNDAFKDRFKKSPREIRRTGGGGDADSLTLYLSYRPPYDFDGVMKIYRSHQVGELEWFEDDRYFRVAEYDGCCGTVSVANEPAKSRLRVTLDLPDTRAIPAVLARIRAMFDLDSDPLVIANSLETDPAVRKLVRKNPGVRLASGWDPFETAVSAILGQLVSVDFGRALMGDLIAIAGRDSGVERNGRMIRLFPDAAAVARADLSRLRTTGRRKESLKEFARRVTAGELSLEPTQDADEFYRAVVSIPGIGPWTAHYMCLKVLRHADAFPATDLILARALDLHSKNLLETMSPWRGYLAALFWREYSEKLKLKNRSKNERRL